MFRIFDGQRLTRWGARLAMTAILAHLVLSFAHIHPLPTPPVTVATGLSAGDPTPPSAPLADDDCAICANIAAFASLDLPMILTVPLRSVWVVTLPPLPPVRIAPRIDYRPFHSRAPPVRNR